MIDLQSIQPLHDVSVDAGASHLISVRFSAEPKAEIANALAGMNTNSIRVDRYGLLFHVIAANYDRFQVAELIATSLELQGLTVKRLAFGVPDSQEIQSFILI